MVGESLVVFFAVGRGATTIFVGVPYFFRRRKNKIETFIIL